MTKLQDLLDYFIRINSISNEEKLGFDEKLEQILDVILGCLQVKKGSIMLRKGRGLLEVRASSDPNLVGVRQSLDEESVSSWVIKNKAPLFVSHSTQNGRFEKKSSRYERDGFLSVPIVSNGEAIGVLNVTDKIAREEFAQEEQQILLSIVGQVIGTLEKQRLIEILQRKERTLQQKNRKIQKEEKLRTELFNMLVHDLKGPISDIVANLDILSYTTQGENRDFVEAAQGGCYTLVTMVGNLLDIAKFEGGKLELLYEPLNPKDLIKEAVARLFGLARMKQLTISEEFPDTGAEPELWGDRGLLLRVLQNLLSNAIEYSPEKGVVKVGCVYSNPKGPEFFVKDEGPGIAPEYHARIFDKYTQLEKKNDGRIYTTGLGLTFCKVAVQAHRGTIGIQSQKGKGSRFYFVLPSGTGSRNRYE